MRSLLLVLVVAAAFVTTLFGALRLMDSGDAPAAVARQPVKAKTWVLEPQTTTTRKPTVAPKPHQSAAERSGDRWVNQAEAVCRQFEGEIQVLVQNRTPQTTTAALYRKALSYERKAILRLHRLSRPKGEDGPLVDRLLKVLDRHLVVFDGALDAIEAKDAKRAQRLVAQLAALTGPTEQAAAELGAFTCAYGGGS